MGTNHSSPRCFRCKTDLSEEQRQMIGEYTFCPECARLPEDTALDGHGCRFRFYHPVTDLHGEYAYWSDAVERADRDRIHGVFPKRTDSWKVMNMVMIRTTEDPQYATDPAYDWDVNIWAYTDQETGAWCFELREDYLSMWDAFPVYNGGRITLREAKEYLHRVGNHVYDHVFENI